MLRVIRCLAAAMALATAVAGSAAAAAPVFVMSRINWDALRKLLQTDPQRGIIEAQAIEDQARRLPPSDERELTILTAQYYRSEGLLQLNQPEAAAPIVEGALRELPNSPDGTILKGKLLLSRAGIRSSQGKAPQSLQDFQDAYDVFVATSNPRSQAVALMGIGSIYGDAGDYARVLEYYKLADEAHSGDPMLRLSSANNQGNALAGLDRFREAEASFRRALGYALPLKSPVIEARILRNIAAMQIDSGQYEAARVTLARGLATSTRDASAAELRPLLLGSAAQLELMQGRPGAAVRFIEQAVAGKTRTELADQSYRELHETAYKVYKAAGDNAEALVHFEAFRKLDDEASALVTQTSAALLAARFDFANQNVRISTLKAGQLRRDVALAQLAARQNAIVLGSLLAIAVIVALLLALYLRSLRRSRDTIRAANDALLGANAELAHAISAKSRFLATTSHEIRTPLNGVLGMTQVLLADPQLDGDVRQRIALVQGAGETMRRLVDDILEFAKIDAGSVEVEKARLDVHDLLDESVRFWQAQAASKGLTLELELGAVPRHIFEDGRRLRQIIYNLLSNALKFTASGGIKLVADADTGAAGETMSIRVTDTGVGIPADAFESIFEMFNQVDSSTTRSFSGTGLGLAISLNLARALGGDLRVASTLGSGSTFTLELPLVRGIVSAESVTTEAVPAAASKLAQADLLMIGGTQIGQRVLGSLLSSQVTRFRAIASVDAARTTAAWVNSDVILVDAATIAEDDLDALVAELPTVPRRPHLVLLLPDGAATESVTQPEFNRVLARPIVAATLIQALQGLFARLDGLPEPRQRDFVSGEGIRKRTS